MSTLYIANGIITSNCRCSCSAASGRELENLAEDGIIKLKINMFDESDPLYLDAESIEGKEGYEDICAHGNSKSIQKTVNGKAVNMNVDEFINYLTESTDYSGGNIRLLSCSTGQGEESFAQQLSQKLGVSVIAPDDDVYYIPTEGAVFVGSPYRNIGEWRTFNSGVEE